MSYLAEKIGKTVQSLDVQNQERLAAYTAGKCFSIKRDGMRWVEHMPHFYPFDLICKKNKINCFRFICDKMGGGGDSMGMDTFARHSVSHIKTTVSLTT